MDARMTHQDVDPRSSVRRPWSTTLSQDRDSPAGECAGERFGKRADARVAARVGESACGVVRLSETRSGGGSVSRAVGLDRLTRRYAVRHQGELAPAARCDDLADASHLIAGDDIETSDDQERVDRIAVEQCLGIGDGKQTAARR